MSEGFTHRVKHSSFPFHCPGSLHRKGREKSKRLFTSMRKGQQNRDLGTTNGFLTHVSWAAGIHQRRRSGGKQWKEEGKALGIEPRHLGNFAHFSSYGSPSPSVRLLEQKAPTGCSAYALIPSDERSKLKPKSLECIFIGFESGVKGYKLWDLVNQKKILSRDVVFDEKTMPMNKVKNSEAKEDVVEKETTIEVPLTKVRIAN
ncbi:hypothetical protein L3X38_041036 [Prunus dulcis]|uniref:Retroviral polymerase SH3-like domain-containing protein n=1 Tax=Prunus dulcis TaxID=3755 RepID=A0AAD4UT98_PRUDU|nr:hypothetical protein L3X38_041036 [Prunus dulcis]